MRRSLQKFETLTKALSKIKGATKVINLAGEDPSDAKSTKRPKSQPMRSSFPAGEHAEYLTSPPELLNQLTLLDHLLRLPAHQLRSSALRDTVSHADLNQPSIRPPADVPTGVSLFSSAAAIADNSSTSSPLDKQEGPPGSPSRRVQFLAADAGFERVHLIPSREQLRAVDDSFPKAPPPNKLSPRTRVIKASSSITTDSTGAAASVASPEEGSAMGHGVNGQAKSNGRDAKRVDAKAEFGSIRLGPKGKLIPRPSANAEKAMPSPEQVYGIAHVGGKGKSRV